MRTLVVLVAALALAASAAAAKTQPFAFHVSDLDIANLVEQQSYLPVYPDSMFECAADPAKPGCVWNHTGCVWDIDDQWNIGGTGILGVGATHSISQCEITDGQRHLLGIRAFADTPELVITVSFAPMGVSFTLTPLVWDRRTWVYGGCVGGPVDWGWLSSPSVTGSNGGRGKVTTVTVTVSNPTDRVVRNIGVDSRRGSDTPGSIRRSYCRGEPVMFDQAGFSWTRAL